MASYRSNVAAILQRGDGKILVAERVNFKKSWQFPQGGVDKDEDLLAAMYREVFEEIGVPAEMLEVKECRTGYRYKFPNEYLKKGKFCGQDQTYFLCDYSGDDKVFDLSGPPREFRRWKWIKPKKFKLEWVPYFKQAVFRRVMWDFFQVRLRRKAARKSGIEVPPPGVPKKPYLKRATAARK